MLGVCKRLGDNMKRLSLAVLAIAIFTAAPASAAEVLAGLFAHNVNLGISVCFYEHGADIQVGMRSEPFLSLQHFGDLRLYALSSLNTAGGVDFWAAGLAWRVHLTDKLYIQPALGAAVQNGDADDFQRRPNHLDLGARILFEPEFSIGYRLAPKWALELAYAHLDHARLAGPQNPGMDDAGVRLIYRLGH